MLQILYCSYVQKKELLQEVVEKYSSNISKMFIQVKNFLYCISNYNYKSAILWNFIHALYRLQYCATVFS